MAENKENLEQFITVTGVDEERARFYLESSAWQLEVALGSFYENDGEVEEVQQVPVDESTDRLQDVDVQDTESPTPPAKPPKLRSKNTNSKFATIHTLNKNNSSDDEEEGQAFYAGGSEHSGQQVLGPSKKKDLVSDMFKAVQEHGVEILEPNAGSSTGKKAFKGAGYKLGQTATDSEVIPGASEPTPPAQITLKLWRDGFSVDNGDLRLYSDPSNREFLDSVRHGEIPQELRQGVSEVHLAMEDHRMEAYKRDSDSKFLKAFSGPGHTLGSPTPPVIGASMTEDREVNEANARRAVVVDGNQPVTNLQIRLADGTRLVGQFNHGHTLADVRTYIVAARPQYETRPFMLLTTYPSKELQDSETIANAGLLNSAIMQKLV